MTAVRAINGISSIIGKMDKHAVFWLQLPFIVLFLLFHHYPDSCGLRAVFYGFQLHSEP